MLHLLILIPFFLQMVIIGVDEWHFHLKRGLPLWERIGHPIDTLSVLACFAFVLFIPFSAAALKWYIGLSILSCLLVTKDEFIHKHYSSAAENWLHALLFLNHPIVLTCAGLIWTASLKSDSPAWLLQWLDQPAILQWFLIFQTLMIGVFFFYQVFYWNVIWKPKKAV